MKTKLMLLVIMTLFIGTQLAQSKSPSLPTVEYSISGCEQDTAGTLTAEIWAISYADHGISCAFVDLTTNLIVTDITYGGEYTIFHSEIIDDFGIMDLGGCTFVEEGAGQNEWSLVATVDFVVPEGTRQARTYLEEASHPALSTSIWGEGTANDVDYGKVSRCRIKKK